MPALTLLEKFKKQRTREAQRRAREAYHAAHTRYAIKYQWRRPDGCKPGADPRDWRSWRLFGSLPILFHTKDEAEEYMRNFTMFKNMDHLRKVSCSVNLVKI